MTRLSTQYHQLIDAITEDSMPVVQALLADNAEPYYLPKDEAQPGGKDISALELAVKLQRYAIVELIFDSCPPNLLRHSAIKRSFTPAMENGDSRMLKLIKEKVPGSNFSAFLQAAIERDGRDDGLRVRALIDAGTKVDTHGISERRGFFPPDIGPGVLQLAYRAGNLRNFKALLNAGVSTESVGTMKKDSHTALAMACLSDFEIAKPFIDALLEKNASIYPKLSTYDNKVLKPVTLPFALIMEGKYEALEYLLEHGLDANHVTGMSSDSNFDVTKISRTLLSCACQMGDKRSVAILLAHGADVHAVNKYNDKHKVALHAGWIGEGVLNALMNAGADLYAVVGNQGKTVLESFSEPVYSEILQKRAGNREKTLAELKNGRLAKYFLRNGEATTNLLRIAGYGLLPEIFAPELWKGSEAEGIRLWEKVHAALPSYWQEKIRDIELTELRREGRSAISAQSYADRFRKRPPEEIVR